MVQFTKKQLKAADQAAKQLIKQKEINVMLSNTPKLKVSKSGNLKVGKAQARSKKSAGMITMDVGSSSKTGRALVDFEQVSAYLVNPHLAPACRWSSEFSELPTAVARPWAVFNAPWSGTIAGSTNSIPNTDQIMCVFRNPLRSQVFFDPNIANVAASYNIFGVTPATELDLLLPSQSMVVSTGRSGVQEQIHLVYAKSASTYSPHGQTLYTGSIGGDERRFFWGDIGENFNFPITPSLTDATGLTLSADMWTPGGIVDDFQIITHAVVTGISTLFTFTPTTSGYFSFSVANLASPANVLNIINPAIISSQFHACHRSMPFFDQNVGSVDALRVMAATVMYTNRAAPLNQQGQIAGLQSPVGKHWTDYVYGGYQSVAGANGATVKDIATGIYGFIKPSELSDFDMRADFITENGALVDSSYPLDDKEGFLVVYAQVTGTAVGQDGYYTISYGLEYQTTDVWRELGAPIYGPDVYRRALTELKNYPQWHENPLHWADLWNGIKSAASTAMKGILDYGPKILEVGKTLAPLLV